MAQVEFYENVLRINLDDSFLYPARMRIVDLRAEQEALRYASTFASLNGLADRLAEERSTTQFCFLGNGDFHHLSYALLRRLERPMHLVVFDNHPDNMIFLKGIHCGSWVHAVAHLPWIKKISIFGISSGDVRGLNVLQNHLPYLRSGKIDYYCFGTPSPFLRWLGNGHVHEWPRPREGFADRVRQIVETVDLPVYLSIDKDVLDAQEIWTTWDQGTMSRSELLGAVETLKDYFVAGDLCGEPSYYKFTGLAKRTLRFLDGEPEIRQFDASAQDAFNFEVLARLNI